MSGSMRGGGWPMRVQCWPTKLYTRLTTACTRAHGHPAHTHTHTLLVSALWCRTLEGQPPWLSCAKAKKGRLCPKRQLQNTKHQTHTPRSPQRGTMTTTTRHTQRWHTTSQTAEGSCCLGLQAAVPTRFFLDQAALELLLLLLLLPTTLCTQA